MMKSFLGKLLIKIILPIFAAVLEETIKLIMESLSDQSMDNKEKIKYVLNGITFKIDSIMGN